MIPTFQTREYCRTCHARTIHDVFVDRSSFGMVEEKQCRVCGSFEEMEECEEEES